MLHSDIPTTDDIERLASHRDEHSVTIYLPTSTILAENDAARLELKNLTGDAVSQLRDGGASANVISEIEEALFDLIDDGAFWAYTSHSLAVFVTPTSLQTFRVPNHLVTAIEVSDRFYIKPLVRATTFSHAAFVLALAQNSVRLVEVSGSAPATTRNVDGLPKSVVASGSEHSHSGRLQGGEGQKVRMRQFSRAIDAAIRPILAGRQIPLILAGAEPLLSIFRSVNSSPLLAPSAITGNPEELTDGELADLARPVLDEIHEAQLSEAREQFEIRAAQGRTALDLGDIARAATNGAVDTLFVDIDQHISGTIDEATGAVQIDEVDDSTNYGVVDEIVRRVLQGRGRVFAVRAADVPGNGATAANLRYPV
jgi:hypothetical protein